MGLVAKTCRICGATFESEQILFDGREIFPDRCCDPCSEAADVAGAAAEVEAAQSRLKASWEAICPPLYRETDIAKIPDPLRKLVAGWKFGPKGLGITGDAGKCKTRAAFLILKGQHFAGKGVSAASATKIASWSTNQFSDDPARKAEAFEKLREIRRAKLLLIDDIGKSKMTERAEQEFYDLLEHRTSHLLPTIWTANASGKELRAMMSPDRGDPIMRRLAEFSEIITTK